MSQATNSDSSSRQFYPAYNYDSGKASQYPAITLDQGPYSLTTHTEEFMEKCTAQQQENLDAAKKICLYVQKKVVCSPNFMSRWIKPERDTKEHQWMFKAIVDRGNEACAKLYNSGHKHTFRTLPDLVEIIEEAGSGNCDGMALVGLHHGLSTLDARVERAYIENGNHAFLVIGRKQGNDYEDYSNWDENTVICDPWSFNYHLASTANSYLNNYLGHFESENLMTMPLVRQFDPDLGQKPALNPLDEDYSQNNAIFDDLYQHSQIDFSSLKNSDTDAKWQQFDLSWE